MANSSLLVKREAEWSRLCILHNIFARELTYNNLDPSHLLTLFERILAHSHLPSPFTPEELMEIAIKESPPLFLKGRPLPHQTPTLSRISNGHRIVTSSQLNLQALGLPLDTGFTMTKLIELMQRFGPIPGTFLRGHLTGRYPLCWATKTSAITAIQHEHPPDYATEIRNRLGLWGGRKELLNLFEFRYSLEQSSIDGIVLRTPTVLDAGPNGLFRPQPTSDDGWGRTVNCATFAPGLPEAVHREMRIDARVSLSFIGTSTGTHPLDYRQLLQASKQQHRNE